MSVSSEEATAVVAQYCGGAARFLSCVMGKSFGRHGVASSCAGAFGSTLTEKPESGRRKPRPCRFRYASFRVQHVKKKSPLSVAGAASMARYSITEKNRLASREW